MTLKQISIFLENSSCRLLEVTEAFGDERVNLKAMSLAGTSGFGILRLLVSDLAKARRIAMERQWPARVDRVVAARVPDTPGSLSRLLAPLREHQIDVEYMYAFAGFSSEEAVMVFGFKDPAKATEVLNENGIVLLGAGEFDSLEGE